jgi:hypothetical protein
VGQASSPSHHGELKSCGTGQSHPAVYSLAAAVIAACCLLSTGCQVDVAGQTLPSPYYAYDDVQYHAAGPEFKLANEAAAMKAYQTEQPVGP